VNAQGSNSRNAALPKLWWTLHLARPNNAPTSNAVAWIKGYMASKPYSGITVVALEQAVAPPYCTSRLADAGARVIKVERPEGDFARGYEAAVHGESSYFVWINRGKESIALDLRSDGGRAQLLALVSRADVFIQNLARARRGGSASAPRRCAKPSLASSPATSPAVARAARSTTLRPTTCWSRPSAAWSRPAARPVRGDA
jgi:hypothetical protein